MSIYDEIHKRLLDLEVIHGRDLDSWSFKDWLSCVIYELGFAQVEGNTLTGRAPESMLALVHYGNLRARLITAAAILVAQIEALDRVHNKQDKT